MNKKKLFFSLLALTLTSTPLVSCSMGVNHNIIKNYGVEAEKSLENTKVTQDENTKSEKEDNNLSRQVSVDTATNQIDEEISLVEKAVNDNIGDYKDNVGIYYYNLNNGAEYSLNADKTFMGASVRKIPVIMAIADDINSGKLSLDTLLYYNKATDYEGGTGILQYKDKIEPITVKEAMALSMKYSDNIAHKMLIRTASKSVSQYTTEMTGTTMVDPEISAKETGKLLKRLYTNPDNNPNYDYIIDLLKNTEFHDRLDKYLPEDKVAHKIGSYYRYYHDAGIIYGKDPYILVIMTKDIGPLQQGVEDNNKRLLLDDGAKACELSAKISKGIYDNLNN